jgi:hypothetical protein
MYYGVLSSDRKGEKINFSIKFLLSDSHLVLNYTRFKPSAIFIEHN